MHRTRVKICGLTREADVRAACALGADAVGFVCFPGSARFVEPGRLAALAREVPPFVTPVLLFVDAERASIEAALAAVPQALLQFHGAEDPQFCGSFGRPFIRALPVSSSCDLLEFEDLFPAAAGLLADAPGRSPANSAANSPDQAPRGEGGAAYGGAGHTFPWERLPAQAQRRLPLILAGGLRADNVANAIAVVRPYAVDVSSGVESARGIKSAQRMREFLAAVRAADAGADAGMGVVQGGAA